MHCFLSGLFYRDKESSETEHGSLITDHFFNYLKNTELPL